MRALLLRLAGAARRAWALVVWRALVLVWCRSLRIEGRDHVPRRPVVVAANHASHTDTVLLQFALAKCHPRSILVAGAADYWFRSVTLAAFARMLGVFPFPRKGDTGVHRARRALDLRATVVLFPQGSRSGGRFRPGIGRIAMCSSTDVLPVYLSGSSELLPKGRRWPRRADIVVRFGEPMAIAPGETAEAFTARLEQVVLAELGEAA
jgi:1-acyl-sn-glycerol-3-phosphate acyltransferase